MLKKLLSLSIPVVVMKQNSFFFKDECYLIAKRDFAKLRIRNPNEKAIALDIPKEDIKFLKQLNLVPTKFSQGYIYQPEGFDFREYANETKPKFNFSKTLIAKL
jgi:hypothetical protein